MSNIYCCESCAAKHKVYLQDEGTYGIVGLRSCRLCNKEKPCALIDIKHTTASKMDSRAKPIINARKYGRY